MFSSRANTWSTKTQSPNGLKVTLVKKRNLQHDHGVSDQASEESSTAKRNAEPRWTIESNKNPCKLVIKRRKTAESSDCSLETRTSGDPGLKVRIVASKARQESETSLTRINNWCKEQISTSLPSTCYDNFLTTNVTLQSSPKCAVSETSLSGELFLLQPSPKDSGIDVSSPPRRFDEIHLTDLNSLSTAAVPSVEVSLPSSNATVSGKLYKASKHLEKTFSVKRENLKQIKKAVAKDTDAKLTDTSYSGTLQNLPKHQSHSNPVYSSLSDVNKMSRLFLRLPTSAFRAEMTGSANERIKTDQMDQTDGEKLTAMNKIDSDSSVRMIPKCEFAQNEETEENTRKRRSSRTASKVETQCHNSVSVHKIKSKTLKQVNMKTVKDADLNADDYSKARNNLYICKEMTVDEKDFSTLPNFDRIAPEKQHVKVDQIDQSIRKKIDILGENYSLSGIKTSKEIKNKRKNACKSSGNKIEEVSNTALKRICKDHISAVAELEEISNEQASETISKTNIDSGASFESESLYSGHAKTTDEKSLDVGDQLTAKVGVRISPRNRSSALGGVEVGHKSTAVTDSDVEFNCQNTNVKTSEMVPGSGNRPETSSEMDRSLAEDHLSEIFSMKRKFKLAPGAAIEKRSRRRNRDNLVLETKDQVTVEPLIEDRCLEGDVITGPINRDTTSASLCVPLRTKRLTRSTVNKPLTVSKPVTQTEFKDKTYPVGMPDLTVAFESFAEDSCDMKKWPLCSNSVDFAESKKNDEMSVSAYLQEDLTMKSSKFESTQILQDVSYDKKPKRNNSASYIKKRRAGSRNSASRRSFERLLNSKESQKLSMEDDVLTSAKIETKDEENCNQERLSFNFENADKNETKMKDCSWPSFYEEKKMDPSEFCQFSPNKTVVNFEDEVLSGVSFDYGDRDMNKQSSTTSPSLSFVIKNSQEISRPHSEISSLCNIEAAGDSDELLHSLVGPLELPSSAKDTFSSPPDLKLNCCTKPTNNYIGEFTKFVSTQCLSSLDSCSSSLVDDVDPNSSVVKTEESSESSSKEEIHSETLTGLSSSSFCQSNPCESEPELVDHVPDECSVQLRSQVNVSMQREFSSATFCPTGQCKALPDDEKSSNYLRPVRTFDDSALVDCSIKSNETGSVECLNSHSGMKDCVSDNSSISENFCIDSVMSIDRELISLQRKVFELLRIVFPELVHVHQEQSLLALPQFLDQVLDAILCAADNETLLQDCHCDCQVALCRNPLNCLKRLQNKVLKLLSFMLPSSNLEGIEAAEIELLVEAVTLANSVKHLGSDDDSGTCNIRFNTDCKVRVHSDDFSACAGDTESMQPLLTDNELQRHL